MKKILLGCYFISAIITMVFFLGMNRMTEQVGPADSVGGGNGNPALFLVVFLFPFLGFFCLGTIEFSMRFAKNRLNGQKRKGVLIASSVVAAAIGAYTYTKATALRDSIVHQHPYFNDNGSLPLWNTFSNATFFNFLTFLMLLLVCLAVGIIWAEWQEKRITGKYT